MMSYIWLCDFIFCPYRCIYFCVNPYIAATASVEGKMSKGLKKVLKKVFAADMQEQLAVADAKLGSAIRVNTDIM